MAEVHAAAAPTEASLAYGSDWAVGTVTRKLHGCFIINHDVFCHKSAYEGSGDVKVWFDALSVGDPVQFIASEHQQGRNKWRANRVKDVAGYRRPVRPAPQPQPHYKPQRHPATEYYTAPQYAPAQYPQPQPVPVQYAAYPYPYAAPYSPPTAPFGYAPMPPPSSPPVYGYHYPSPPPGAFSSPYSDMHSPMPPHLSPMLYFLKPSPHPSSFSPSDMSRPLSPNQHNPSPLASANRPDEFSEAASDTAESENTVDSTFGPQQSSVRSLLECSIAAYRAAIRDYWADGDEAELMARVHKEGAVYGWQIHFLSTLFQLVASEKAARDKCLLQSHALTESLVSAGTVTAAHVRFAWVAAIRSDVFAGEPSETHAVAGELLGHSLHAKLVERTQLQNILAPLNAAGSALSVALSALKTLMALQPQEADVATMLATMGLGDGPEKAAEEAKGKEAEAESGETKED